MSVHVDDVCGWSSLPVDILLHILSFLSLPEDVMVFRGVCSSWRSTAKMVKFLSKVPFLMLAENKGSDTDIREFYSLSKRKICARIPIPDAKGDRRCTDVGFGWILILASSGKACLVKPFSPSARIQLPSFKTFEGYEHDRTNLESRFITRAWLSADPSETSNFVLIGSIALCKLGFWRNGDELWTRIRYSVSTKAVHCYEGKIYILDMKGNLLIWDLMQTNLRKPEGRVVRLDGLPLAMYLHEEDYLVRSTDGELLVITRNNAGRPQYITKGVDEFVVKRLDPAQGVCVEIDDVGKDAIFLGDNAAVAVDAVEFPGVLEPNSIYFTDDRFLAYSNKNNCPRGGGKDKGIYNVKDKSIERFDVESYSHVSAPLWVFPSF